MFRLLLTSFLSVLGVSVISQNLEAYEAEELFNRKYYSAVWKYYENKLKKDSLNAELNYKMGICYLNSRSQKDKAIHYLKRAATSSESKASYQAMAFKQLGDANYLIANFDNAISNYEKYRTLTKSNPSIAPIEDINREIEMCKMAKELQELKEITAKLVAQNEARKSKHTSAYEKTGYSISNPSPAFAAKKIGIKSGPDDKEFFEENKKSILKNQTLTSRTVDSSKTKMETTIASSTDGQIILIYRDDDGEANIYTSVLNGNEWMEPEKLNKAINNSSWEPNEFISSDGNTLYFASKRDDGYGGKDIYKSEKLTGGDWGKAINLGPRINTAFDEEAPFLFPDGATLYFSSNRNRPKGGFDNFTSFLSDSAGWSVPINIGYPLHETIKPDNSLADTNFKKENYISTFISQKNAPITIVKGKIVNNHHGAIPPFVEITVANNETGTIAGIYRPDSKNGKYTCIVPSGKNNNVTFEAKGYLFHSENIAIPKDQGYFRLQHPVVLNPIAEGSKTVLNNIFFEEGKAVLTSSSEIELNKILHFLKSNPGLRVEISGSVEKKSPADDTKLMEEKIQSVINFLTEKGIDKGNIEPMVYKKSKRKKTDSTAQNEESSEKFELKILASK